jgi:hypothetical protein
MPLCLIPIAPMTMNNDVLAEHMYMLTYSNNTHLMQPVSPPAICEPSSRTQPLLTL